MPVTAYQKMLVEKTFRQVANDADDVAALFYARLFQIAPSFVPLFKGDMTEQGRKFMQMIAVAVGTLNRPDTLVPVLEALGARHVGYGVKKENYEEFGSAFLWTLEHALGEAFTPDVKNAWMAVYRLLAETATAKAYSSEVTSTAN
jgi:nitric oxide dioxygenase